MALKFKDFTWPNDPETYQEAALREPKYTVQNGVSTYQGMGSLVRRITGTGAFFGEDAYRDFQKLVDLAEQPSAGNLIHPIWGTRYCYLTRLVLEQEPRGNYVHYSFEFTQAQPDGTIAK